MSDEVGAESPEEQKGRAAAEQASALEKLTDRVEEKELDASRMQQAMADLSANQQAALLTQQQRERELAKVKVDRGDVDLLVNELELDRRGAERRLKERAGDLRAALESYL